MNTNLYKKIILNHQLLRPTIKENLNTLDTIKKLSYIQIDSLNIVNRAHHHTLWNRVNQYDMNDLNRLVNEKKIFEYWFHAASYLPMSDYRFAVVQMNRLKNGKNPYVGDVEKKDLLYVLDKIKNEGALKARDFKSEAKEKGSWWNWKPYKNALEKLFMEGDLMACRRDGMEKVYDLKSRVLPNGIDSKEPSVGEYALYLIESSLKAHGLVTLKQILHLKTNAILKKEVQLILKDKVYEGSIEQHSLNNKHELFSFKGTLDLNLNTTKDYLKILSPFDNALIHREKLKSVFGFDYKIECYTPKEKRIFGYFSLPILFNDDFVARVDCKAHRKEGILEIIHLHFEESFIYIDVFSCLFVEEIKKYTLFNGCEDIVLRDVSPSKYFKLIEKELF